MEKESSRNNNGNYSLIENLKLLRKKINNLKDDFKLEKSTKPKKLPSKLMSILIKDAVILKKKLGPKPKKSTLDKKYKEKVRQFRNTCLINSKIIMKNHELRTSGLNERALGIELLTEEIQKRNLFLFSTETSQEKILKFTKKNEILALLLKISQINELIDSKKPKKFGKLHKKCEKDSIALPRTLYLMNKFIAQKNIELGMNFSLNRNKNLLMSSNRNQKQNPTLKNEFLLNCGKTRQKMKISETKTMNFFDLKKGPILADSLDFERKNVGILEELKRKEFTEYNFKSDFLNNNTSFFSSEKLEEGTKSENFNIFGSNGENEFCLFTQKSKKSSFMNAFSHQGKEFAQDPFLFTASLPEKYEPFKFKKIGIEEEKLNKDNQEDISRISFTSYQELNETPTRDSINRNSSSVFFNSKILDELNNGMNFNKRLPNFWEDLEESSSLLSKKKDIQGLNIITKGRSEKLKFQIDNSFQDIFSNQEIKIENSLLRKNLDLMLMGLEGDFFVLDKKSGIFIINNNDKTLNGISSITLNNFLLDFIKPGSKLYQLQRLQEILTNDKIKDSFTNKTLKSILNEYIQFVNKSLIEIPQDYSMLNYRYQLQPIFDEVELIHGIFFKNKIFTRNLKKEFEPSTDSENLDFLYDLLKGLHRSSENVEIVNYMMEEALKPIIKTLTYIVFREPDVSKLNSRLKIEISKNSDFDFIFKNVPGILKDCINDVLITAQNLSMLKSSEKEIFKIFVDWNCELELAFSQKEATNYLVRAQLGYDEILRKLAGMTYNRKVEENEKLIIDLKVRLLRLKQMKLRAEKVKEKERRMKEIERFKRAQLQNYLQSQIYEKRFRKRMEHELEKEFEKSLLLDTKLREKNEEKQKIIDEMVKLGDGFDQEIESLIHKDNQKKIKEFEIKRDTGRMQIETIPEEMSKNDLKKEANLAKPANVKIKEASYATSLIDIKNYNRMFKLPSKLNLWQKRKQQKEKIIEKNKSLVESLAFGALEPPLSVMFDLCINKVIRRQAELTNSILLQLFFEKYQLMDVLYHYKKIFMCARGDFALEFMDWIYNQQGELDEYHIYNLNSVFEGFEDEKLESVKFDLQVERGYKFTKFDIITTHLHKEIDIKSLISPPMSYLMSDQVTQLYFQIFCFLIKIKHHYTILSKLWKFIDKELPRLRIPTYICRKLQFIRHSAQVFCSKYCEYVYHVVIEGTWKMLLSQLGKAETFNNVFKFHASYLSKITKLTFCFEKNETLYDGIHSWMKAVYDFEKLCKRISYDFEDEFLGCSYDEEIKKIHTILEKYQSKFRDIMSKFTQKMDKGHIFDKVEIKKI